MKRLIILLLATLLLPGLLRAQYVYTTNNGTLTITRFTGGGAVIIPSIANGLPVTSIDGGSFNDNFALTSVVIPDSITNVGDEAFSDCYSMTNVTLGTNVLEIGNNAFEYCSKLPNILIPASVTNIGLETFLGCTVLTNITVVGQNPAYTSIDGVLFNKDVTILVIYPQDLAGPYTLPESVADVAEYAFDACTKLTSITSGTNLLSLEADAFSGCYSMTNIALSTNLASIGVGAFDFCTNISSIAIPVSVTNIQPGAFAQCFGLTNCAVETENQVYSSLNGVIFDKNQTTLVVYPAGLVGSYLIPPSVTSIADAAFAYANQLWNVTFPSGLTNIGLQAFYQCSLLTNAPFPNSLVSIGATAFYNCSKLVGITIGDSVTTIGNEAFGGCTSFTNATVGDGVANIGNTAFGYCLNLRTVRLGNGMTNIGYSQFQNCSGLTSVTVGVNITNIEFYGFANCSSLTNITFLGNAPGIPGFGAFNNIDPAVKVYYLPGTTGWGTSYGGAFDAPVNVPAGILPTVLLANTPPPVSEANVGIFTNQFGFTITGASNETVIVQVSSDLVNWTAFKTNTPTGTSLIFSDPNWRNYPQRFYRLSGQ